MASNEEIIELGHKVLDSEINALKQIRARVGDSFVEVVRAILACKGTVILSGVGKPYFIAQKISASMASTGTPSIALHPVDALHGDMGRIRDGDVVIVLSNSGVSSEIVDFTRATKALEIKRIAMTCRPESTMANLCDLVLDLGQLEEACPMGVAPSTTSTAMLALGDALTLALVELRGFTIDSFARNHPGGSLGKRLSAVETMMRGLDDTAVVTRTQTILETLGIVAEKRGGAAFVVDAQGKLLGVFTDGDVRRLLTAKSGSLSEAIEGSMTKNPKSIEPGASVEVALDMLRSHQINCLAVVDADGLLVGHLDIQDIA
ncbi:MAG: KpsF/GutQ family sugar-phosphate isomerase [Deltaproteobacteria bacterium]|jgi:arabinose-5-phosphate isomerase|nr:KpsF/GutQ family sugar-phosphate isomerase [Deltaproteobacteria bacterium]MBT6433961.1 KpsF/GutQ family sugar-phosphate isomerase [Deltaproteobacteria bacterium]MBT6491087.1 KpsF/GutQ family sugar-phosphate isomerase [Deltaproteobacteria bacterium]